MVDERKVAITTIIGDEIHDLFDEAHDDVVIDMQHPKADPKGKWKITVTVEMAREDNIITYRVYSAPTMPKRLPVAAYGSLSDAGEVALFRRPKQQKMDFDETKVTSIKTKKEVNDA